MGEAAIAVQWRQPNLEEERRHRQNAIEEYAQRLKDSIRPTCIILFGSMARGTDRVESDVDLVVIGGKLPERIFDRLDVLARLEWGIPVSIDAFPYTEAEFERMLDNLHVTALECIHHGIPLHGEEYFDRLRPKFEAYVARGLRRGKAAWYFESRNLSELFRHL